MSTNKSKMAWSAMGDVGGVVVADDDIMDHIPAVHIIKTKDTDQWDHFSGA